MENLSKTAKKFYYGKIRKPVYDEKHQLLLEINETSQKLRSAYNRFENECNDDLVDSLIYEIQALKSLYRFQIKQAKELGLQCTQITVF